MLESMQTSCSGYERVLAEYSFGDKLANPIIPICGSETNKDWDET